MSSSRKNKNFEKDHLPIMCSSSSPEEKGEKVKETENVPMNVLPKNNTSNLRSNSRKIIKTYGNIITT